jgi:hypothetical protein
MIYPNSNTITAELTIPSQCEGVIACAGGISV